MSEINRVLCNAWMEEDKMFVATRASDYTIKCLQKTNCVTLTGPAGVGKSFVARHVALDFRKRYEIIPVYSPTDMRDYYQHGKHTLFIIDDMFGKLVISQQQIEQWAKLLPVINTILKDNCCKIIVACRLDIFNDVRFNMLSPFKSCECNFISNKLCLTDLEKKQFAITYIGKNVHAIDDIPYESVCFPLLCSLHHEHKSVRDKGSYKNQIDFYKTELDNLRMQGDDGKYKICSLAVCVLLNAQLEDTWFLGEMLAEQKRFIEDTFNAFRLQIITKLQLKAKIDILDGIFISTNTGSYKIIDDKLLEFLTLYFCELIPECFIQHGDSKLIHTKFIRKTSIKKTTCNKDFIFQIPNEYLELYIKRLIDDWSTGNVAMVFSNINMKEPSFRNHVVQKLQQLDKSQQQTLSNSRNVPLPDENDVVTSPLLETCSFNFPEILKWLLDNDVDVNQIMYKGITGLLKACQKGHTTIVTMLLEKNCNVNLFDRLGHSPLHFASRNGHTDVVKLLLMKNPDVDICDKNGCSPLYMASQKGHTEVVNMLLLNNSDVDLCDNNGCSPLIMAIKNEHINVVKLLLEKNPNVNLCDNTGCFPLYMACQHNRADMVKLLLDNNADVNICDKDGHTPMFIASQNGSTDIVKLFTEYELPV